MLNLLNYIPPVFKIKIFWDNFPEMHTTDLVINRFYVLNKINDKRMRTIK